MKKRKKNKKKKEKKLQQVPNLQNFLQKQFTNVLDKLERLFLASLFA